MSEGSIGESSFPNILSEASSLMSSASASPSPSISFGFESLLALICLYIPRSPPAACKDCSKAFSVKKVDLPKILQNELGEDLKEAFLKKRIKQDRRLSINGFSDKWHTKRLITINSITYRLIFDFVDLSAMQGKISYNSVLENLNMDTSDKNLLDDLKDNMLLAMLDKPDDFQKYALGDLNIYEAFKKTNDLFTNVYKDLKLDNYITEIMLTTGSTVNQLQKSILLKYLGLNDLSKDNLKKLNMLTKPASASNLRSYINAHEKIKNGGCLKRQFLSKTMGGRCYNNRMEIRASSSDFTLCDQLLPFPAYVFLARFMPDGTPDVSFGNNGSFKKSIIFTGLVSGGNVEPFGLFRMRDRILVGMLFEINGDDPGFGVLGMRENGKIDSMFGNNGQFNAFTDLTLQSFVNQISSTADNNLFLSGYTRILQPNNMVIVKVRWDIVSSVNEQSMAEGINIYPNPVQDGFFQIDLKDKKKNEENLILRVRDLNGRICHEQNRVRDSCTVNASQFPSGLYFVELIGSGSRYAGKLSVQGHE